MSSVNEELSHQTNEALRALYNESSEGVIVSELDGERFVGVNRAICRLLGYTEAEMLSLSVNDIHPTDALPRVKAAFQAMAERRLKCVRDIPCLCKDGTTVYVDISSTHIKYLGRNCILGLFHDITEQKRAMELLRASDDRYRTITNNVADVIWTVDFPVEFLKGHWGKATPEESADAIVNNWRFSYVSPALELVFGYTQSESKELVLRDLIAPEAFDRARKAISEVFSWDAHKPPEAFQKRFLEVECRAKDGSLRSCEIVSSYMRDKKGVPIGLMGVTRDVTDRRQAEKALHESEATLRGLFENLPDIVVMLDRDANIQFINRSHPSPSSTHNIYIGDSAFSFVMPEHLETCRNVFEQALVQKTAQTAELHDIFGNWWSCRMVPIAGDNAIDNIILIATDITETRLAAEAVKKEQRLLRQLLELHERERRLISCEIHDGFAQQLTGAIFRLQAFRDTLSRDPEEAWKGMDSAISLLTRAIDEARRLISGLRPPILDELGIVDAVQYLVYEQKKNGSVDIEYLHDLPHPHLPSNLEDAVFRIIQESLQNACRHSRSDRIRISLIQCDDWINIEVQDWGIGFDFEMVEDERFGLQGIRERARLLDGKVTIESAPNEGTRLSVAIPVVNSTT